MKWNSSFLPLSERYNFTQKNECDLLSSKNHRKSDCFHAERIVFIFLLHFLIQLLPSRSISLTFALSNYISNSNNFVSLVFFYSLESFIIWIDGATLDFGKSAPAAKVEEREREKSISN